MLLPFSEGVELLDFAFSAEWEQNAFLRWIAGDEFGMSFNEFKEAVKPRPVKSSAQIILRWQIQAGYIAIPGSSNPDHIAENYDVFDFELTVDEMEKIYQLDRHERYESW